MCTLCITATQEGWAMSGSSDQRPEDEVSEGRNTEEWR